MSAANGRFAGALGLSPSELRVLGCLLEKRRTTPDAYPLSLNALCLACNQSTNRDPVVDYDQATVRDALHRLERRGFTRLASGAGSRAPKYRHLLDEALPMDAPERAILCVLMLRGAQTPGELKQRAERMHAFADLTDVREALARLVSRELAVRLERRPGQKEERYAQLLEEQREADATPAQALSQPPALGGRALAASEAAGPAGAGPVGAGHSSITLEALDERLERLERVVQDLLASERAAMRHPSTEHLP